MARRYLWQAALAAWLTVGPAPEGGQKENAQDAAQPEAREIATRAVLSGDDHVIKLCYSALCEYREYGDPAYLRAALRKLELDV
jgi:hypothetical protein